MWSCRYASIGGIAKLVKVEAMKSRSKSSDTDVDSGWSVVLLRERDDALDLGCALEDGDGLLGGVGEDERPGGGGTPGPSDEAERVERACGGRGGGEEGGGRREEEGLRGHGGGGLWEVLGGLWGVGDWRR
jgi:hypothetical protein